jgi:hypothetical protein
LPGRFHTFHFSPLIQGYRENHPLPLNQLKTMNAIESCRTSALVAILMYVIHAAMSGSPRKFRGKFLAFLREAYQEGDLKFFGKLLLHVLPSRFVKIRHYGILSNRNRNFKLRLCQKLTLSKIQEVQKLSMVELLLKLTGLDLRVCPICKQGKMVIKQILSQEFQT